MNSVARDRYGFLLDPAGWTPTVARWIAREQGIEELGGEHWRIVDWLREHYLEHRTLPVMKQVCHELELDEGCVSRCFGNPRRAWAIAGLPDPGEEARAYMETAEQPGDRS